METRGAQPATSARSGSPTPVTFTSNGTGPALSMRRSGTPELKAWKLPAQVETALRKAAAKNRGSRSSRTATTR